MGSEHILSRIANPMGNTKSFGERVSEGRRSSLVNRALQFELDAKDRAMKERRAKEELTQRLMKFEQSKYLSPAQDDAFLTDMMAEAKSPAFKSAIGHIRMTPAGQARNAKKDAIINQFRQQGLYGGMTTLETNAKTADIVKKLAEAENEGRTTKIKDAMVITGKPESHPDTQRKVEELYNLSRAQTIINNAAEHKNEYYDSLAKSVGKAEADLLKKSVNEGKSAIQMNHKLDNMEKAIDNLEAKGIETGIGTDTITNLKNIGNKYLGLNLEGVTDAEVIRSVSNELALSLRNPDSGLGLTGNTSEKDLQFLIDSVAGLSKSTEGNRMLIKMMRQANSFKIRRAAEYSRLTSLGVRGKLGEKTVTEAMQEWVNREGFLTDSEKDQVQEILSRTGQKMGTGTTVSSKAGVSEQPAQAQQAQQAEDEEKGVTFNYNDLMTPGA